MPSVRPASILVSQRQIWGQDFYTAPILNTLPTLYYKVCNKQNENFFNTCKTMLISIVGFLVILHPQTTSQTPSFSGGVSEFEMCNCIFLYVCAHLWWGGHRSWQAYGMSEYNHQCYFSPSTFHEAGYLLLSKRLVGLKVSILSQTHIWLAYTGPTGATGYSFDMGSGDPS